MSSNIEIINGVLVHELWGDLADTTLIAHLQYVPDAEAMIAARLERDGLKSERRYIITNLYDGKQFVRAQKKPQQP